jgi:outer membrane protein W
MKLVTAAAFLVGLTLSGTAHAGGGGYVSLGVSDATLSGDLATHFETNEDSSAGRLALGQRVGRFAFEVALYGTDMKSVTGVGAGQDYSTFSLGVAGKYYMPITGKLEGYGKLGLDKTWVAGEADNPAVSYSGRGYNLGAGLEYGFSLSFLAQASVWIDYTVQRMSLTEPVKRDLDGGTQLLSLGLSVGF